MRYSELDFSLESTFYNPGELHLITTLRTPYVLFVGKKQKIYFIFTCKNLHLSRLPFLVLFEKLVHGLTCRPMSRLTHLQIILDHKHLNHIVTESDKPAIDTTTSKMIYKLHTRIIQLLTLTDSTVSKRPKELLIKRDASLKEEDSGASRLSTTSLSWTCFHIYLPFDGPHFFER